MAEASNALTVTRADLVANGRTPEVVAAAERERAHIESAYQVAIHRPRNIDDFRLKLLKACERPRFAEMMEYRKPIGGGKSISGISIKFADLAFQLYGNAQCDTRTLYDDTTTRTMKVVVTDFESNATKSSDIVIPKTVERKAANGRTVISERTNSTGEKTFLVAATDDEVQTKQAALVAKARRNLILELLPKDIVDEAKDRAAATVTKGDAAVDPNAAKRKIIDVFADVGVKPHDLETYLHHSLDVISKLELDDLRKMYRSIADGEAKWSDFIIGGGDESDAGEQVRKSPFEKKKTDKKTDPVVVDAVVVTDSLSQASMSDLIKRSGFTISGWDEALKADGLLSESESVIDPKSKNHQKILAEFPAMQNKVDEYFKVIGISGN